MTKGGSHLQLVAEGPMDVFLIGNPQMTFFKKAITRTTQFAIESVPMTFQGTSNFGKKLTCEIQKHGDLLGPLMLQISLPAPPSFIEGQPGEWVNSIGHALIQDINIEIGEEEIDKQTGEWMEIWTQHTVPAAKREAFNKMIGRIDGYPASTGFNGPMTLMIPLHFWFCRDPGHYLPLVSIQHKKIRINLTIRSLEKLVVRPDNTPCKPNEFPEISDMILWGDFVHLGVDERRRFASAAHDYIIEQVQYSPLISIPKGATNVSVPIEFNHSLKEFFWYIRPDRFEDTNDYMNFSSIGANEVGDRVNLLQDAVIQLDGIDRFEKRSADYFRFIEPYKYHTAVPYNRFIYNYSFNLYPEEISSSGFINLSGINTVTFQMTLNNTVVPERGTCSCRIYGTNYNVFRVLEGTCGLLFRA